MTITGGHIVGALSLGFLLGIIAVLLVFGPKDNDGGNP